MKYAGQINKNGQSQGMMAFGICSVFLLLGAAAGCYAGSHTGAEAVSMAAEGRSFGEYLGMNLTGVILALVLGSSCIGFLLLPLLSSAAGFVCGFIMAAVTLLAGGWSEAFMRCGWFILFALPVFSVLCACAMRFSAAGFRLLAGGIRPDGEILRCFLKVLMISVALAVLLAIAASAA